MIIVRSLNGLTSGAVFRDLLADILNDLNYVPYKSDPDVHMCLAFNRNGFKYYEHVLVYVDDVLFMSDVPTNTMKGMQHNFKCRMIKLKNPQCV